MGRLHEEKTDFLGMSRRGRVRNKGQDISDITEYRSGSRSHKERFLLGHTHKRDFFYIMIHLFFSMIRISMVLFKVYSSRVSVKDFFSARDGIGYRTQGVLTLFLRRRESESGIRDLMLEEVPNLEL